MKLIRKALIALAASVSFASPASATVDAYTPFLLRSVQTYGAKVAFNGFACNRPGVGGSYVLNTKTITVCYKGTPTANDHDTVRHEVAHFIQHCVARKRGNSSYLVPIVADNTVRNAWIQRVLTPRKIQEIMHDYPPAHVTVELEAWAMAKHYSATQMNEILKSYCS
jgi:hypothetical protein